MQETTRKYQQLTDYWTKCCYLSLHFSLFTAACASFAFLSGTVFSVFGHRYSAKLNATSDHSRGTWFFSKLSLAKYHFLHKKPVFTVTSIYFILCLLLLQHVFTNFSLLWIILHTYFNHFQKQPPEVFHKKAILKHFVIFTGKHLTESFFNKVEDHQPCYFIKKRFQDRYFLVNFGKFIRTPILKKNSERLHFWKVFCENIFSDQNLAKGIFDDLLYERLLKLVKIEQKCFQ